MENIFYSLILKEIKREIKNLCKKRNIKILVGYYGEIKNNIINSNIAIKNVYACGTCAKINKLRRPRYQPNFYIHKNLSKIRLYICDFCNTRLRLACNSTSCIEKYNIKLPISDDDLWILYNIIFSFPDESVSKFRIDFVERIANLLIPKFPWKLVN